MYIPNGSCPATKNSWYVQRGHYFFVKIFLSLSAKKYSRWDLFVSQNTLVTETFI